MTTALSSVAAGLIEFPAVTIYSVLLNRASFSCCALMKASLKRLASNEC
jgi:hypothetical protein